MTRDEAVSLIQGRLGNRTGQESLIQGELRAAQAKFEEGPFLPWFLLKVSVEYTGVNTNDPLPVDYLREDEENEGQIFVGNAWGEIKRDNYTILSSDEDVNGVGKPQFYSIYGDNIYWFPAPDTSYRRRIFYYAKDTILTANIENKWLKRASGLMVARAGLTLARNLRDPVAVQLYTSDYDEALSSLKNEHAAQRSFATVQGA